LGEICAHLGQYHSLSLMLWLSFLLWSKVVCYLLEALYLAMVMKILGNYGFVLHALGIGKENLHFVSYSFLFQGC
jgi:hypothetical protein